MAYYKIAEPTYRRTNDGHIDGKYGLKSNNSTQVDDEKKSQLGQLSLGKD